jgi:hypothetical protein
MPPGLLPEEPGKMSTSMGLLALDARAVFMTRSSDPLVPLLALQYR